MNIAIIGAGTVGSALASALVGSGHRVYLAARSAEHAAGAARSTGAEPVANAGSAAALADVIVLAVPYSAAEAVARAIGPVANGKTVVDVSNPSKPDWSGPLFTGTDSAAEQLARWLPEANVVKAFNTVFASNLGATAPEGATLDGYVAGDSEDAKARVLELVESIGLKPIDAGPLAAARQLEALAWLNIALNSQPGWSWNTGWKLVGAPASRSASKAASPSAATAA